MASLAAQRHATDVLQTLAYGIVLYLIPFPCLHVIACTLRGSSSISDAVASAIALRNERQELQQSLSKTTLVVEFAYDNAVPF